MRDSAVAGGEARRNVDVHLSEKLGGYRSKSVQSGGEASAHGKYVEPMLHATEHAGRCYVYNNPQECAGAKDELNSVGRGLHQMDRTYQDKHKNRQGDTYKSCSKRPFTFGWSVFLTGGWQNGDHILEKGHREMNCIDLPAPKPSFMAELQFHRPDRGCIEDLKIIAQKIVSPPGGYSKV